MDLHRNYKFRIYPTKTQQSLLNSHFFASNQAWNHALALKKLDLSQNAHLAPPDRHYTKDSILETAMKCALQERKITYHSGIVQESFKNMNQSLKEFYKKRKTSKTVGFPRFKSSRSNEQSFRFKNQGVSWNESHFRIMKQDIKWVMHRPLPDRAKLNGVVVKRTSDMKYWVILNLTIEQELPEQNNTVECGIDMNVGNVSISDSSGASYAIKLPDFSKSKYLKSYKKHQQCLSKRYKNKNFSKKTKKLQLKLNRIQQKIKNQKEDFFHKVSKDLTDNHNRITIEDLKIKQMKESEKTHKNRMISDVSWGSLILKIKYKAEAKNVLVREVNPAFSSQRCNRCGHISRNNRNSQSEFHCENCQHTTNADLNASKNILEYDNWSLEQKTRWTKMSVKSSQVSMGSNSILLGAEKHQLEAPSFRAG